MTAARVAAIIARAGETVTLRRLTGTQRLPFEVSVKASIARAAPSELVGNIAQFTHTVTIANAEILARQWPGPPKKGDQIVTDDDGTLAVLAVDSRKLGEEIALHVLTCKG